MIFKTINFIIFIGILVYFLKEPLKKFWLSRRISILSEIEAAASAHKAAKNGFEAWQKKRGELDKETTALKGELKKQAEIERAKILEQAKIYADRLVKDAKKSIENETTRTQSALKNAAIEMAVDAASLRLLKGTTREEHTKIIQRSVKEVQVSL